MQHKADNQIKNTKNDAESNRLSANDSALLNFVAEWLLRLPRSIKKFILLVADYAASILCLFLALSLRLGVLDVDASPLLISLYALVPIVGLYLIGFYRAVTRIFIDTHMRRVLLLFINILIAFTVIYLLDLISSIPRSVPLIYLFMLFIWLWGSRLFLRDMLLRLQGKPVYHNANKATDKDKVIIYGAGSSGTALLEALHESPRYQVVAFVDDDPRLAGGYILDKKIYLASGIKTLVSELDVAQVFLAMPSSSHLRRREIIDRLTEMSVK